jgi:hypothetical protein
MLIFSQLVFRSCGILRSIRRNHFDLKVLYGAWSIKARHFHPSKHGQVDFIRRKVLADFQVCDVQFLQHQISRAHDTRSAGKIAAHKENEEHNPETNCSKSERTFECQYWPYASDKLCRMQVEVVIYRLKESVFRYSAHEPKDKGHKHQPPFSSSDILKRFLPPCQQSLFLR